MIQSLPRSLHILCQSAKKELSRRPIATAAAVVGVAVVMFPLLLSESLRDSISHQAASILLSSIVLNPLFLGISASALLAAFVTSLIRRKRTSYFEESRGVKWKVSMQGGEPPWVDETPYCALHQIKTIYQYDIGYYCPVCGPPPAERIDEDDANLIRQAVQNVADAKYHRHLKIS